MKEFNESDPLMTPADVSNLLQISRMTIYKWIYERRLPSVKIGNLVRIRRSDALNLIRKNN